MDMLLELDHISKIYGDLHAVDDLSLHIRPGEIYGFIGHNGAGKTTTLRCVVGILQFDAGEITIGGRSIRTDPIACKRELAYIPDNPDLYDYMTGIRYLNFIADIFDVSAEVRGQRIHDYAAQVEKMKCKGMDPEEFESYLMIHKHGMPPHGGLGIGLERLTMKLCGLENVREASLFPRDQSRLEP